MRIILISSFFSLFYITEAISQYRDVSKELFLSIKKIDSVIDLNNVDYELINLTVLHYTNEHRYKKNKNKLVYNKTLEKSALLHSSEMKKYNFFDHINRKNRKFRTLENRAKYVNYQDYIELAENLYYGYIDLNNVSTYKDLGKTITKAFIDSRTHNLNLLDKNLKELGLAIVFKDMSEDGYLYYYFTQSFGARQKN